MNLVLIYVAIQIKFGHLYVIEHIPNFQFTFAFDSDSDSSLPVIDCGKVANDSDCIKNEKEFDVDNDCVGRSWFSKTDTSRVNAVQICKYHGYSGEILKYSANLGINCNYEVKYARQDGNLTDLGYRVVWKCEGNKYV